MPKVLEVVVTAQAADVAKAAPRHRRAGPLHIAEHDVRCEGGNLLPQHARRLYIERAAEGCRDHRRAGLH